MVETGHLRTIRTGRPVDTDGRPVPWFTYPAIAQLGQYDWSEADVLEWGAGNSTLWWAEHARAVVAIESDAEWHREIGARLPSNGSCVFAGPDQYVDAAPDGPFDVVVIDGINRAACVARASDLVSDRGLVIIDDSNRYPDLCRTLRERVGLQIDFEGFGPIVAFPTMTSMFFKPGFGIPSVADRPVPRATY